MFFVDNPYVSEFFKKTIMENNILVVGTEAAKTLGLLSGTNIIHRDKAGEPAEPWGALQAWMYPCQNK